MFYLNEKVVTMEELVKVIQPGDVGVEGTRPSWNLAADALCFIIQHWTQSWANHAFLFTGQFIDPPGGPFGLKCDKRDYIILESIGKGVTASKLSSYAGKGYIVKFIKHEKMTDEDRPEVIKTMFKEIGHGYDFTGLLGFFLRPLHPFYHNILSGKTSYFCSAAVAYAYAHRRMFFRTDVDSSYVSPGDIWGSGASIHY